MPSPTRAMTSSPRFDGSASGTRTIDDTRAGTPVTRSMRVQLSPPSDDSIRPLVQATMTYVLPPTCSTAMALMRVPLSSGSLLSCQVSPPLVDTSSPYPKYASAPMSLPSPVPTQMVLGADG